MGHRFSKSVSSINHQQQRSSSTKSPSTLSHHNSRSEINDNSTLSNQENLSNQISTFSSSVQQQQSSTTISSGQNLRLESATLTVPAQVVASGSVVAGSIPRRFIIKIQLTKMEPGDSNDDSTTLSTTLAVDSNSSNDDSNSIIATTTTAAATATVIENVDNNLNITNPVLNLTFTKNIPCDGSGPSSSTITSEQHQIVIENGNETFQLNNLNANTTSATINSNFVDNFALSSPSSSSSSSPSSSQIVATTSNAQLFMDTEGNNNFAGQLNNLNLPTKAGGFTHSNIIINNSTHNHNSNGSNNNFSQNSINCNSGNDFSNLNNDRNSPIPTTSSNSICNNENEECNAGEGGSGLTMCNAGKDDKKAHCCQSRKKPSSSTSSAYPTKWRCCKCSCRDSTVKLSNTNSMVTASTSNKNSTEKSSSSSTKPSWVSKLHRVPEIKQRSTLIPHSFIQALASSSNPLIQPPAGTFSFLRYQQQQQQHQQQQRQSIPLSVAQVAIPSTSSQQQQQQSIPLSVAQIAIPSTSSQQQSIPLSVAQVAIPSTSQQQQPPQNRNASISVPRSDHLTMWEPVNPLTPFIEHHHHHHHHHHIQALAQCAGGPHNLFVVSVNPHPTPSTSSAAAAQQQNNLSSGSGSGVSPMEIEPALANVLSPQTPWHHIMCGPSNFGTVVHSQVDYIHCLVPDLEKITNSSFYWGKMDRYEAERLLEGKPEGTFLLRDSAQEEYLFSVTFRKYGRSLHARIEQFNHKFSFDGHDPGVFTANTVTGLLEHYKDPSCVMFFEPMLTIPLHRNFTFSLQQLCRATIVSHVTYDGINELLLPNSLKSYLKEYHYKLRVRVKPFDEPFYTCS